MSTTLDKLKATLDRYNKQSAFDTSKVSYDVMRSRAYANIVTLLQQAIDVGLISLDNQNRISAAKRTLIKERWSARYYYNCKNYIDNFYPTRTEAVEAIQNTRKWNTGRNNLRLIHISTYSVQK